MCKWPSLAVSAGRSNLEAVLAELWLILSLKVQIFRSEPLCLTHKSGPHLNAGKKEVELGEAM